MTAYLSLYDWLHWGQRKEMLSMELSSNSLEMPMIFKCYSVKFWLAAYNSVTSIVSWLVDTSYMYLCEGNFTHSHALFEIQHWKINTDWIYNYQISKIYSGSPTVCRQNLRLYFTVLEKSQYTEVKTNAIIALSDMVFRYPNELEPWTPHLYARYVSCG